MKSDSEIRNALAQKTSFLRQLSEKESTALKSTLLDMYMDVKNLCDQYNIKPMLGGGSALGSIRHKGFIPWDDDLDIIMLRKEYEHFITMCEHGLLGDKYEFTYPSKVKDCKNLFLKIYLKGSEDVEIHDLASPFPKGIYIDIFPIDIAPKPGWKRKLKGLLSNALAYTSISVIYWKYRNPYLTDFMTSGSINANVRFRLRSVFGCLCSIIPLRKWVWGFDSFVQANKDTGYFTVPTGRKFYIGELLPTDVFFPASVGSFEGKEVYLPHDIHTYLTNLYGDYMWIPPVDKRERHMICRFSLPYV